MKPVEGPLKTKHICMFVVLVCTFVHLSMYVL